MSDAHIDEAISMGAVCGFSGTPNERLLQPMLTALAHRGQFPPQVHVAEHGTLAYFPRGDAVERKRCATGLAVNEESALAISGLVCKSDPKCHIGTLLNRFQAEGAPALEACSGDYVAAAVKLADDGQAEWHLVRDASGARTIYYACFGGRLFFASEPKGIWNLPGFPRRIRPASIVQYFTFSFIPGAATMLEGIEELEPGHALVFRDKQASTHRYFRFEEHEYDPQLASHAGHSQQDWPHRTRQLIAEGIRSRLPADEDPAVFLSGGLDSSVIACEVQRQSARPVHTYALHFGKRYPNELEHAAAVARHCGTRHEEVEIKPKQFLPDLRRMVWHLDDPIGDPITMPNMQLAQHVARHHRWVFNGEGGDPCFGGPKNIPMLVAHWYGGASDNGGLSRERAYLASYRRGYEVIPSLLTPEWAARVDQRQDLESVLTPFFSTRTPKHFINKLFAINIRLKGAHLILPKVERMLGAAGISPLSPLFTREIVHHSFLLPPLMKMSRGDEKIALKRAYADALPASIISRPKSGMRVPVHYWFQGELKRYARSLLSRRRVRAAGIFDPDTVQQLLNYNLESRQGRYGLRLWMLITFELWRRIVVENEPI